jgi:hypothetical protein
MRKSENTLLTHEGVTAPEKRFCLKIKLSLFISLFILLLPFVVKAQSDSLILISGRIVEKSSNAPVPFAYIASFTRHLMYSTDSSGRFYIELPVKDSIKVVMLGFESSVIKIDSLLAIGEDEVVIPIRRTSIMLNNIDINLRSSLFSVDERSKKDAEDFETKDLNLPADVVPYDKSKDIIPASIKPVFKYEPPVIVFFLHPVSYINYFTSKKEKEKRKMVKIIMSQKSDTLFTRELVQEVSGFKGDSLEKFIIYCNQNLRLEQNDDIFSVRKKVFLMLESYNAGFKK